MRGKCRANRASQLDRDSITYLHVLVIHGAAEFPTPRETLDCGTLQDRKWPMKFWMTQSAPLAVRTASDGFRSVQPFYDAACGVIGLSE